MSYSNIKSIYDAVSEQGPVNKQMMRLFFDEYKKIVESTKGSVNDILSLDLYTNSTGIKKYNKNLEQKEDIKIADEIDFSNDIEMIDILKTVKNYIENDFSHLKISKILHNKENITTELLHNISGEDIKGNTSDSGNINLDFNKDGNDLGHINISIGDETISLVIEKNNQEGEKNSEIKTNIELLKLNNLMIHGVDYIQQSMEINKQKYNEDLTGLYNGKYLEDTLNKPDHNYSFIFIDVSRFKEINDTYGQVMGDKVLIEIAQLLEKNVRSIDKVARLGGDEFAILIKNPENKEEIQDLLDTIIDRIQSENLEIKNDKNGELIAPKLSIGTSINIGDIHKNKMALVEEANKMLSENKDPIGAAYRFQSMFASFDQKTKVLAMNEILLNKTSRDYFYRAIVTEPVTGSFFKGLLQVFKELKESELIRNTLTNSSVQSMEEFKEGIVDLEGYKMAA